MMTNKRVKSFLIKWAGVIIFGFLAFREFYNLNILAYVGTQNIWESKRFIAFLIISIGFVLGVAYSYFSVPRNNSGTFINIFKKSPNWMKSIVTFFLILLPGMLKWMLPLPENFSIGFWMEFFIIFYIALLIESLFHESTSWAALIRIGSSILLAGAAHAFFYKISQVTDYPFTLYWSEGNRFFDYSALFGSYRYFLPEGEKINAFTTWGMQLPWALPFIFPGLTIGFFRLWYQLMWVLPTFILGITAAWHVNTGRSSFFLTLIFACWTFLFLDQGPIYAPLVIGAIMTLIAVRAKLFPGVLIIFAASYYTRNARWTWSYAPGLWAGLLALLAIENPSLNKNKLKEFIKPLALGISGYLGGHLITVIINSINSASDIKLLPNRSPTYRQPLIWNRLLPNPTFPPGILWALVWAALPLILLLVVLIIQKKWRTNWLQNLALIGVPGAFLVVGIIASVKIGGGSNLHNLDMFLISLVLTASCVYHFVMKEKKDFKKISLLASIILFIALVSPVTFTLIGGSRLELPSKEKIDEALIAVNNKVKQYGQQGELLFIDHRHLLTFNLVNKVPLVDEYEKKYLMDQALANNEKYFAKFYEDLSEKRFALIVNEPSNIVIRGSEFSFGEENDAYLKWVTIPLLCKYEPIYSSPETSLELLIPRKSKAPANLNCDTIFAKINN